MRSIAFPEMFNHTTTNLVSDYDATLQNIKLLLWSEKGELFGDPYYGTGLKRYLFDQNDVVLQDILLDDIYSALVLFIPQIEIDRKDIKLIRGSYDKNFRNLENSKGTLTLVIRAMNKADYTTDLYNIVLLQADA